MLNPLGEGRWHEKWRFTRRPYGNDFTVVTLWGSLKWKQSQPPPGKQDYRVLEGRRTPQNTELLYSNITNLTGDVETKLMKSVLLEYWAQWKYDVEYFLSWSSLRIEEILSYPIFYILFPKRKLPSSLSLLLLSWFKLFSLAWIITIACHVSLAPIYPKLWPPEWPFSNSDLTCYLS